VGRGLRDLDALTHERHRSAPDATLTDPGYSYRSSRDRRAPRWRGRGDDRDQAQSAGHAWRRGLRDRDAPEVLTMSASAARRTVRSCRSRHCVLTSRGVGRAGLGAAVTEVAQLAPGVVARTRDQLALDPSRETAVRMATVARAGNP